jgi:hypothetical protein
VERAAEKTPIDDEESEELVLDNGPRFADTVENGLVFDPAADVDEGDGKELSISPMPDPD